MSVPSSIEIAPSILAADFASLGDAIRAVERAGVSTLHVDVMDGHFVPNISIGVPVVSSLRKATRMTLDVHLMIENPDQYIEAFAAAGADMISVHQEATPHLDRVLTMIREHGCRPGAVINPATPVAMLSEVLGKLDHVLVMSVNPGFGGQAIHPRGLEKSSPVARTARARKIIRSGLKLTGESARKTLATWFEPVRKFWWPARLCFTARIQPPLFVR